MGTNTQNSYKYLNRAQLSINYLHSNSTTHEFLFGALAEMIDNSRDANAKNIHVFTESHPNLRGGHMLCFLDDGCGMNPTEARDIMTFGRSFKKDDLVGNERKMIGQYGNGLKSGSMRIGHDFILFTKCQNHPMTCLMLSRTFHEEEKIDEVIVPSPSFNTETLQLFYDDDEDLKEKAELELSLILKYSPFQTMTDLMARFCSINGPSGTLVCVYTLKLDTSGKTELDFLSYPTDILLAKPSSEHTGDESTALLDEESYVPLGKPLVNAKLINGTTNASLQENSTSNRNEIRDNSSEITTTIKDLVELTGEPLEKVSLRAYLAMLYFGLGAYSSRMLTSDANRDDCSLWLRNSRVSRIHWLHWLYKYKRYTYTCNKFKAKAESDYKKTLNESKIAEEIAREAESKERDMRKRYGSTLLDKQKRMEIRKALEHAKSLRRKADLLKQSAEKKQKSLKDPKSLDLIFGLNVNHRSRNGAFIYNQGRLIKLYQPFNNHPISSIKNNGVVCLVDIPYELLEPTHNKQDFADEKEWKLLKNVINTHFNDYISDIIEFNKSTEYKNWKEFWKFYGYETDDQIIPNHSAPFNMRRLMIIPKYKQCARCMKFRKIPFQTIPSANNNTSSDSCGIEFMIETGDEFWECAQNIDRKANRCEIPEQKVEIPLAKLRKTLPNNNHTSNTTIIPHNKSSLALGTANKNSNHKNSKNETSDQEDTPSDENDGDDDSFRPGRDRKRPNYRERSISPPLSTMENNLLENVEIQNSNNNHKLSNNLPSTQMNTVESALASLRRPPNLMPNTSRIKNEYESQNSTIGISGSLNGPPSVLNAETLLDNVSNDILATNSKILSPKKSNTSTKNSSYNNNNNGIKRKNTTNAYKTSHSGSFSSKNSIDNSRIHKLEDKLTRLSDQLKEILKYFTPPNYHFTAEDVDRFDIDSLINLNLGSLKNQYQEEIKKLIEKEAKTKCNSSSSLQDNKMYEKTIADYKLLRKNVSNMLILANLNNCELPPDCQTEKVDEIVQSLVQTLQQP